MPRAIWSGSISFGLLNVPVKLYSAVSKKSVSFRELRESDSSRIRHKRVAEADGEEVAYEDIVKGYEIAPEQYVVITRDELEELDPKKTRAIEIKDFVDLDEIDPIYYQKSYYLGPKDSDNASSYALLRDALKKTNRAGIAKFVMRGKEYLATIRADGKVLVLETMFFADEIRDPDKEVGDLPRKSTGGKQLSMAVDLFEAMSGEWKPAAYKDTYTQRVQTLVDTKRKGKEVVFTEEEPEATTPTDLVAALRASVDSARKSRTSRSTKKKTSAKKPAAKKSSTRKKAA